MPFSDFYFLFKCIFQVISLLKSRKRVTNLQLMMWRADVARGTTARMRRGAEATWQGRTWPMRGARGAQGVDTWQEAKRVHTGPRGHPCGAPCGRGSAGEGPTG